MFLIAVPLFDTRLTILPGSGIVGDFHDLFKTKVIPAQESGFHCITYYIQMVTTIQSGATAACDLSITVILCWVGFMLFLKL